MPMPPDGADGALSDQTLDRLRISAAMALAVPHLSVKIRIGEKTCLEVRRTTTSATSHRVLAPCAFHGAVAGALRMRRSGERIAMRGVPARTEPAIDWGALPSARVLTGGIIRVDADGGWLHVAAVLGDEAHVADALAPALGLTARRDEALEVSILQATTPAGDKPASRAAVDALLDVVSQVGVADLEQRLGIKCPHRGGATTVALTEHHSGNPTASSVDNAVHWFAGCPTCGTVDLDSAWPRPDLVQPRAWLCSECCSATWEPVPLYLP